MLAGILDKRDIADGLDTSDLHNAAEFYLGAVVCVQQLFSTSQAGPGAGGGTLFCLQQHVNPSTSCRIPTEMAERAVRELFSRVPGRNATRTAARVEAVLAEVKTCLDGPFAPTIDVDKFLGQLLQSRQVQVNLEKAALEAHLTAAFSGDALSEGLHSAKTYQLYADTVVVSSQSDRILLRPVTARMADVIFADAARKWQKLRKTRRAGNLVNDVQLLSRAIATSMASVGTVSPAPFKL